MNLDYKSKYLKYKKKYLNLKLEGGGGIIKDNTVIGKVSLMSSGTLCGKKRNGYQCTLPFKTKNNVTELMFPGPEEKTYVDAIIDMRPVKVEKRRVGDYVTVKIPYLYQNQRYKNEYPFLQSKDNTLRGMIKSIKDGPKYTVAILKVRQEWDIPKERGYWTPAENPQNGNSNWVMGDWDDNHLVVEMTEERLKQIKLEDEANNKKIDEENKEIDRINQKKKELNEVTINKKNILKMIPHKRYVYSGPWSYIIGPKLPHPLKRSLKGKYFEPTQVLMGNENAHKHFGKLYKIALEKYLLHIPTDVAWSKVKLNIPNVEKTKLKEITNYKQLIEEFIECLKWLNDYNKFDFLFKQYDIKEKRKMMQKGMMFTYPPSDKLEDLGLMKKFVEDRQYDDNKQQFLVLEKQVATNLNGYLGKAIYENTKINLVDVFSKELLKYDFEKAINLYAIWNATWS